MANDAKKKSTDDAALDAVEQALSIDFDENSDIGTVETLNADEFSQLEQSLADAASDLELDPNKSDLVGSGLGSSIEEAPQKTAKVDLPEYLPAPPPAANDQHSIEVDRLMNELDRPASGRVYMWTFLISLIWIAGCSYGAYTNVFQKPDAPATLQDIVTNQSMLIWMAIGVIPLLLLWCFAAVARRAQELRHAANSMTQVTMRLLQPEKIAADSVATVGNTIRREVTAIGEGVERAIARACELENIVQKEVLSLEQSYGDSEIRLKRLIDDISAERTEIADHVENLRNTISRSEITLTSEIESAGLRLEEMLNSTSGRVSDQLDTRTTSITATLSETSENLMELLGRTGSEISGSLGEGRQELEITLNQKVEAISNIVSTSGNAVAQMIESQTANFQQVTGDVEKKLDAGKRAFEVTFDERKKDLDNIIVTAGNAVSTTLKESTDQLAQHGVQFNEEVSSFVGAFSSKSDELSENLAKQTDDAMANIAEQAAVISNRVGDQLENHSSAFNERVSLTATALENAVGDRIKAFDNTLLTRGNNLFSVLGTRTEALEKVLDSRSKTIESAIVENLTGFGVSMNNSIDNALSQIDAQNSSLKIAAEQTGKLVAEQSKEIETAMRVGSEKFAENLEESLNSTITRTEDVTKSLESSSNNFSQAIDASTSRLDAKMSDTAANLANVLDNGANSLTAKLNDSAENLVLAVSTGTETLDEKLGKATVELVDTVNKSTENVNTNISKSTDDLLASVNSGMGNLNRAVLDNSQRFNETVTQSSENMKNAIEETSKAVTDEMRENITTLGEQLNQNTDDIKKQFDVGSEVLSNRMETGKEQLLSSISNTISDASVMIDSKAEKLTGLLSERANLINNSLGKSLVDTQRQLETKTSELSTLLSDKSGEFDSVLNERANQFNEIISERTSELNELLTKRSREFTEIIDYDAKPIIASLEATGEAVNDKLSNLSKTIVNEANILFENLGESSDTLENLIRSSVGNLNLIQTAIAEQSESFVSTVAQSSGQYEAASQQAKESEEQLRTTSEKVVRNMLELAQRIEFQGSALDDVTKLMDITQSKLASTLEDKQSVLYELADGVLTRSNDIENSFGSFSSAVTKVVDEIQAKTASVQGEALSVGQSLSAEMTAAIDDATSRFSDSVVALRDAAASIRDDLENTREQMRRGVLELPDETAQSASAMRRVVTDQIAALKDLSSIVERSGKLLDTSTPRSDLDSLPTTPFPTQQQQDQLFQGRPAAPRPEQPVNKFPPVTRAPAPAARSIPSPVNTAVRSNAPAPQATRAPSFPAQGQDTRGANTGWVSDLLRRASQEEPAQVARPVQDTRSPDQYVESLNSLSMDIASAIDHETSVELWDRYQRGETNVFTRRLYTLHGQQTFDEIRNKYGRDRDFKQAVDQYIADFEKLLSDVSKNDRDGSLSQSYLVSDTGKVYTMLAHASGRFGNN